MFASGYLRTDAARRFFSLGIATIVGAVLACGAFAADPAKTFDELYGPDAKAASASKDTKDAADFSKRLLDEVGQFSDNPSLREYILNKVIEFGIKDRAGLESAIQAAETLISEHPEKRTAYRERLLDVFRVQYEKVGENDKFDAGEEYIRLLLERGDELLRPRPVKQSTPTSLGKQASQPTEPEVSDDAIASALKYFKTALAVADAIKSTLALDASQKIDAANELLESRK